MMWALLGLLGMALAGASPGVGLFLGLLGLGTSCTWFAAKKTRPWLNKVFLLANSRPATQWSLAIAASVWAFIVVTGSLGGLRERAKEREREAVAQAERERQKELRSTQRGDLVAEARIAMEAGDLDTARDKANEAHKLGTDEGLQALTSELAEKLHERERAKLPTQLKAIIANNDAGDWDSALATCNKSLSIDADFEGLARTCATSKEGKRQSLIPGWIDTALAVAADKDKCNTALDIANAWENLRKVEPDDPGFPRAKRATAKLERCRKRTERDFSKAVRSVMVMQRENWAEQYELSLLDQGIDARVSLKGKHKDKVKIRWVLLGRAIVHQITRDGTFLAGLEKIGFKRVTFSDGFYESWYYDLSPQSEEGGGKAVLDEMGLDRPLTLE